MPSNEDLKKFFDALSTGAPEDLQPAMKLAEEGSVAEAYAGYLMASANASIDAGYFTEGTPAEETGKGYASCNDPADQSTCVTWADVRGRGGKIVSFTVNGRILKEHILAGDGQAVSAGGLAKIKFLYAYEAATSPTLFVAINVQSGNQPVVVGSYEANYRGSSGRQSTASGEATTAANELAAKSNVTMVLGFSRAELGGVVTLPVYSEDFYTTETVTLPTR